MRSVALFLESDGDGPRLAEALARAAEERIGVAVLKVGSSAAGAGAAAAHTGSLAGDHRVFRALIEEAGGAWATNPHELLELARALSEPRARPRGDGGLAVLTCSGGDSGVAADEAEQAELELPTFAETTHAALTDLPPRGDGHEPARLHGDDLGRLGGAAPDRGRGRRRPGDRPAAGDLRPPARPLPRDGGVLGGGARGNRRRRRRHGRRHPRRLDASRPDRRDRDPRAGGARRPRDPGLSTALACARELRRPLGDAARLREIAAARASPRTRTETGPGSGRPRRRSCCARRASRSRRAGSPSTQTTRSPSRTRSAGRSR